MNRSSKERTSHPAQFPVAVIKRIIKACSKPDQIVLDPFAGSGSTLVAAGLCGRRSIGIELNGEYNRIAEERLRVIDGQPELPVLAVT